MIEASMFGKVKTCVQIAAILAVIAVPDSPLWVSLLVYLMVAITVLGPRLFPPSHSSNVV